MLLDDLADDREPRFPAPPSRVPQTPKSEHAIRIFTVDAVVARPKCFKFRWNFSAGTAFWSVGGKHAQQLALFSDHIAARGRKGAGRTDARGG